MILEILDRQKLDKLCKSFSLRLVILFGSAVKGVTDAESDVDIGVVTDGQHITAEYEINLVKAFSQLFQSGKVDVVALNHADSLLLFQVATHGVLLFEKKQGQFNDFKVEAFKKHNDGRKFYQLDEIYVKDFLKREKSHG
jgi:predicted nucleotidyltransferase